MLDYLLLLTQICTVVKSSIDDMITYLFTEVPPLYCVYTSDGSLADEPIILSICFKKKEAE